MRQLSRVPWWVWALVGLYYAGAMAIARFLAGRQLAWVADVMWATYFVPSALLAYFAGLPGGLVGVVAVGLPLWFQTERLEHLMSFRSFEAGPVSSLLIGVEASILMTGLLVDRLRQEQRTGERDPLCPEGQGPPKLAVLMFDLDDFKGCNDRWGHETGDLLLQAFGRVLQESVRASDPVVRYGGDEFVVILVDADRETALGVVRRLQAVAATAVPLTSPELWGRPNAHVPPIPVTLTFSGGVALCPQHGRSFKDLLRMADQALYGAKRRGGRCVVFADEITRPADVSAPAPAGRACASRPTTPVKGLTDRGSQE